MGHSVNNRPYVVLNVSLLTTNNNTQNKTKGLKKKEKMCLTKKNKQLLFYGTNELLVLFLYFML